MKNIFLLLFLIGLVANAQEIVNTVPEKNLKLGGQIISYRYVEPGLIEHTGLLYGITAEGFWFPSSNVKGVFNADLVIGKLDYNGALCNISNDTCSDYSAKTNEFILRMTHRFEMQVVENMRGFAGPGIRYLIDKGDDRGFYTRTGIYLFIPVGGSYHVPLSGGGGSLFIDAEYDIFLAGVMTSRLSEVNPSYEDITHVQNSGSGHKITLGYQQDQVNPNPLTVGLFYENWNVAESDRKTLYVSGQASTKSFVEPKNFSESIGLKIAVGF